MQPNYKNEFWKSFDENFEPNYLMVIRGLTIGRFESTTIVNTFHSGEKESATFYLKAAQALMKIENLDDDVSMPCPGPGNFSAHSLNLKNFLSKNGFDTAYQSIDEVYLSNYREGETNINADFSFVLGNFSRFFKNGAFHINDKKRCYVLTAVLEKFTHQGDQLNLQLSSAIDGSSITIDNQELTDRLWAQLG